MTPSFGWTVTVQPERRTKKTVATVIADLAALNYQHPIEWTDCTLQFHYFANHNELRFCWHRKSNMALLVPSPNQNNLGEETPSLTPLKPWLTHPCQLVEREGGRYPQKVAELEDAELGAHYYSSMMTVLVHSTHYISRLL